jgi:hypothetical protein
LILDRNPTFFLALVLDMRNAFNTIRRADIAEQLVKQGFPELIPYFNMCYDKISKLRVRMMGHGVPSEEVISRLKAPGRAIRWQVPFSTRVSCTSC